MSDLKLGKRTVGPATPTFIIAEIGINHNGDLKIAKKLIKHAADAGFDAVAFAAVVIVVVLMMSCARMNSQ